MTYPALPLYPRWLLAQNRGFTAIASVACMAMLLLAMRQGTSGVASAILSSLGGIALFSMPLFFLHRQASSLLRAIAVMHSQRTPSVLWRTWLRRWLLSATLEATLFGILVSAGVHEMFKTAPYWRAMPVLISLAQCLCACHVMAASGMLPRVAARSSLLLCLLAPCLGLYFVPVLAWLSALPAVLLAAGTLAWPVMAWYLYRHHCAALPKLVEPANTMTWLRHSRLAAWISHHQFLREDEEHPLMRSSAWMYLLVAFTTQSICGAMLMSLKWGGAATPLQSGWLLLTCQLCTFVIMANGVHWRTLLMPGHLHPRRLGTHILLSTLSLQLALLAVPASVLLVSQQLNGSGPDAGMLATGAMVLLQLLFCTAVAIVLRALPLWQREIVRVALPLVFLGISMLSLFYPAAMEFSWQVGPSYAALLVAGTCAAMLIANRLWTPARLITALKLH